MISASSDRKVRESDIDDLVGQFGEPLRDVLERLYEIDDAVLKSLPPIESPLEKFRGIFIRRAVQKRLKRVGVFPVYSTEKGVLDVFVLPLGLENLRKGCFVYGMQSLDLISQERQVIVVPSGNGERYAGARSFAGNYFNRLGIRLSRDDVALMLTHPYRPREDWPLIPVQNAEDRYARFVRVIPSHP